MFQNIKHIIFGKTNEEKLKELHYATKWGKIDDIKDMIDMKYNLNACDEYGYGITTLMHALKYKELKIAKMLIEAKCDLNLKDHAGHTALHYAIEGDLYDIVLDLINNGCDTTSISEDNDQPFFRAIMKNNIEIGKLLINKSNLNLITKQHKSTPLTYACNRLNIGLLPFVNLIVDKFIEKKDFTFLDPIGKDHESFVKSLIYLINNNIMDKINILIGPDESLKIDMIIQKYKNDKCEIEKNVLINNKKYLEDKMKYLKNTIVHGQNEIIELQKQIDKLDLSIETFAQK